MTSEAQESRNVYSHTVERMEPDIAMVDTGAALVSIAISLARIADALYCIEGHIDNKIK